MPLNRKKFFEIIEKNKGFLKNLGVISIGIFGYVDKEENTKKSDYDIYDILVKFKKEKRSFKKFITLCDFLENI